MDLKLIGEKNQITGNIAVSDQLFNRNYNEALVHQVITSYLSNARGATRAQKGRSDVAKSTRKPWRQKGTGRARAGMASSPIWRGGGKIFPSSPDENFRKKLNKKMYRIGMSVIFSQLLRESRIIVANDFDIDTHKTKKFTEKLAAYGLNEVMLITNNVSENLYLSSRNVPHVSVIEVKNIDPVSLLKYEKILLTSEGMRELEDLLS